MNRKNPVLTLARLLSAIFIIAAITSALSDAVFAQEKSRYLQGEDNALEMIVYIIGEVKNPGKYRVRDDTNLIELLAEAGGPSEYSNLNAVTITHVQTDSLLSSTANTKDRVIRYNINNYLQNNQSSPPPMLKPGDVIMVPKNKWRTWRNVATVIRDISVVASAYFLYLRATR